MPSIQGPAQPTQAVATHCGHMVFCYQNIMVVDVAERDPWTGYSHSNRGSPLGQNDWSCFEAVSAVAHPIATEREDHEDRDLALTSSCWASPLGLGTTELQHRDKSHLHLSTAGAHSQVVALFDPGHRRYIVPRLLHLEQLGVLVLREIIGSSA